MALFTYPHTMTISSRVNTLNAANQYSYTWVVSQTGVKGRWSPTSLKGARSAMYTSEPAKRPNENMVILFPANVVVLESDQISNVLDKRGTVLEAGPLTIESVVSITTWDGLKHHSVARLRKVEAL